jgi:hypothetical protein
VLKFDNFYKKADYEVIYENLSLQSSPSQEIDKYAIVIRFDERYILFVFDPKDGRSKIVDFLEPSLRQ